MSIVSKILLESRGVPSIIETIAEEASVEITKLVPKLYTNRKNWEKHIDYTYVQSITPTSDFPFSDIFYKIKVYEGNKINSEGGARRMLTLKETPKIS